MEMAICGGGIPTLMLLILIAILSLGQAADTWQRLPSLETFSTYEDMQRYFDQRNFRSMRHIDNPTGDTYLAAFNQYNEQVENQSPKRISQAHSRIKREQRQLPTAPRMLRFELADAVEPSPELKQILRQYHARALKENPTAASPASTTQAPTTAVSSTKATKAKSRKPRRQRRSVVGAQQPADFKVKMIPFEETDAREPDPITAQLIKKARSLDLQSQATRSTDFRQAKPQVARKQPIQVRIRKTKRSKRSAPQMIKFELADAKAMPQRSGKQMVSEAVPTLLTMETQRNKTQAQQLTTPTPRVEDNDILTGEATAETKRMYVYKEAPVSSGHVKTKKSLSTLPHEVQKVISQLMKDGLGGKAYVKYLPAQKSDYEHYKAKSLSYGGKPLVNYVKYINKPAEPAASPPPVQVHIQPVPVVEQLRYVYKPHYAAAAPTIAQPIVVQEAPAPTAAVEEVHHTYTAELAPPPTQSVEVVVPQFRPSKPDPLLAEAPAIYGKPQETYNSYELQPEASPLIKIEYHAQPDSINEHYKQLPEFQQLSTLIGKSPDDQIHGLTYLLAKEMQAKLQRQGKQLVDRPQDSTAPILFHPGQGASPAPTLKTLLEHGSLGVQPGRLIGMAKTKQYVPIIEPGNNDVKELPTVPSSEASKLPTPSSYIDYTHGHGLSNGYEGVTNAEEPVTTVEHVVHHPTVATQLHHQVLLPKPQHHHHQQQHHGLVATVLPAELDSDKGVNGLHFVHSDEDKSLQQYASKYAFGYRIRDFHTGNDFGHKQNRDLHGVTRGQYHILLPDGRIQNVIYHADDTGFHADVSFEGATKH
ncbi:uncharacterized protein LOC6734355 [Drosophila simulans]|uniref:uncharacterized protein LOC6734355 n=1 Tax=Drosophila simulans TaxID=7240 RepID=UPI00192CE8A4|nr:uncharacterized protein LOC6734355 [Drosophila simulans]XP_039147559.1 uncharacterized protein LOC6734355 [Drosophila simulans]